MMGEHLSQDEFSEKYAADPTNFGQLRDFAHKHGLTVDEGASSLARCTMVLRGPAGKMESAFGVTLDDYEEERRKFHSYTGTISMPREYAEPVEAVLVLDNHPIAMRHFRLLDKKRSVIRRAKCPRWCPPTRPRAPNSMTSPTDPNADGEVALDIEVAGSIAPVALDITITVASGDNGSSDGATGNNFDFPASGPHVLGCGGTELTAANGKIQQEIVWNDQPQGGASGGGVSSVFSLPPWQMKANVPTSPTSGCGRGVTDVAANASPETGYNVLFDGQFGVVGGTSAVAPLWAALIARLNQQRGSNIGFANLALYQNA